MLFKQNTINLHLLLEFAKDEIIIYLLIYLNGAKLFHFNFVVWNIFATFALSLRQRDLLNHEVLRIEKEAK